LAFVENCALAHYDEQKGLRDHEATFFDFENLGPSIDFKKNLYKAHDFILYGGVVLSLLNF
jgi:uncharacterized membrane protein